MAGEGETNALTVTQVIYKRLYTFDDRVPIEAGEGCVHPDPADLTLVTCDLTSGMGDLAWLDVELGDGNDTASLAGVVGDGWVEGGLGADTLGSDVPGGHILYGGDGDDVVRGGSYLRGDAGNDTLYADSQGSAVMGGEGNDTLTGNYSPDRLTGGPGTDFLSGGDGTNRVFRDWEPAPA